MTNNRRQKSLKLILVIPVLMVLWWVAWYQGTAGIAQVLAYRAVNFAQTAADTRYSPAQRQAMQKSASALLHSAIAMHPDTPHLRMTQAALVLRQPDSNSDSRAFAAQRYQEVLQMLPTWPFAHLGVAYTVVPDRVWPWLQSALRFGPQEPGVLIGVMQLLPPPDWTSADGRAWPWVSAGLSRYAYLLVDTAIRQGQMFPFCDAVLDHELARRACEEKGWTPP